MVQSLQAQSPLRMLFAAIALMAALVGAGWLAASSPALGISAVAGLVLLLFGILRGQKLRGDIFIATLAGVLLFSYGFANLGIRVGIPIPLTQIALAVLLPLGVRRMSTGALGRRYLILVIIFGVFALAHLLVALPTWGVLALRDFTLPMEAFFLPVGYWAYSEFGLARWVRISTFVLIACAAYFSLYPFRETLMTIGPVVGLQRPTPFLGVFTGAGNVAAAGFLFFGLVRPLGSFSYWFAAWMLALVALVQSRGLYVSVPLVLLIVFLGARGRRGGNTGRRRLLAAVVAGGLGLLLVFAVVPGGRLGPVSPEFVQEQLGTLTGAQGEGAGSFEDRKIWFRQVMERVNARPLGWLTGVGLGPDLIPEFDLAGGVAIRKPHNDYLEVFARLGLPGLVLLLCIIFGSLIRIFRSARRATSPTATFLWWLFSASLIYALVAATQPLLAFPYGTVPLFTLLGAGLCAAETRSLRKF